MSRSRHIWQLPRRQLLRALGLGMGVGPILPLLNATGAEPTFPKRLILVFEPDGAPAKDYNTEVSWQPQGSETDFTFGEDIHQPLEPMKSKLVVPWGLKLTAGGAGENHAFGMCGLWTASTCQEPSANANFDGGNGHHTGWGSGPSIDQVVAKAFGPDSPYQRAADDAMPETLFRSVQLGVECLDPAITNRMIYAGKDQPLHPEDDPRAAFDRLFKNVKPTGSMPVDDGSAQKEATRGKAVVDNVAADLKRLRLRIGAEDYAKVDAHLEGLAALERSLGTGAPVNASLDCEVPGAPAGGGYDAKLKQMSDIAVAALACDVTRVLSLQWSYGFSHIKHTWIGLGDHHGYSHDGQDRRKELSAIDSWYAQQFLYLLQRLDSVKEGNGTMLDNTLVVIGRELGNTSHNMARSPILMAGGARGALKTGRFLNFDGQEHVKLLVSIGRLMGLDINSFGNRVLDSGPLAGIG